MSKISKPTRVMVSGDTIDGRVITPEMIQDMADTYDENVYAARVNCEHIDGITPLPNGQFPSYGTVKSLSADEYKFTVDGAEQTQLALYAVIEVNDEYLELNGQNQKIYWSAEATPKFASTEKWYLSGLAITDNPASLCTETIKFSKTHEFSAAFESSQPKKADANDSILQKLNTLGKTLLGISSKIDASAATPVQNPPEALMEEPDKTADFKEIGSAVSELVSVVAASKQADEKKFAELEKRFAAFTAFQEKVENSPSNNFKREPVSGGHSTSLLSQF